MLLFFKKNSLTSHGVKTMFSFPLGGGAGKTKTTWMDHLWWFQHIITMDIISHATSLMIAINSLCGPSRLCIHDNFRISLWKLSFGNYQFAQSLAYHLEAAKINWSSIRQPSPKQEDKNIELLLGQIHYKGMSIGRNFPLMQFPSAWLSDKLSDQKVAYIT